MTNETLENLNKLNEQIDIAVCRIKELENENEKIRAARIKQAEYIGNLLDYLYMTSNTGTTYKQWFKNFEKEMNLFYETRNNKRTADSPDSNSMHSGNDILQSGGTAAGTDKVHECRA